MCSARQHPVPREAGTPQFRQNYLPSNLCCLSRFSRRHTSLHGLFEVKRNLFLCQKLCLPLLRDFAGWNDSTSKEDECRDFVDGDAFVDAAQTEPGLLLGCAVITPSHQHTSLLSISLLDSLSTSQIFDMLPRVCCIHLFELHFVLLVLCKVKN